MPKRGRFSRPEVLCQQTEEPVSIDIDVVGFTVKSGYHRACLVEQSVGAPHCWA